MVQAIDRLRRSNSLAVACAQEEDPGVEGHAAERASRRVGRGEGGGARLAREGDREAAWLLGRREKAREEETEETNGNKAAGNDGAGAGGGGSRDQVGGIDKHLLEIGSTDQDLAATNATDRGGSEKDRETEALAAMGPAETEGEEVRQTTSVLSADIRRARADALGREDEQTRLKHFCKQAPRLIHRA